MYAKDILGYESNEEVIEVTTDNYVNPVVNSVTTTNIENDSITVSASATAGTNAIQTYYYSINNGSYTSSSSNTYTFSSLNAGQSYSIKVYVVDTNVVDSDIYTISAQTESIILLTLYSYYSATDDNWMYLGSDEWTISRFSSNSASAFWVYGTGLVFDGTVYRSRYAVRPVFYLTSFTTYVSGSGTSSDPIRIN